MDIGMIIGSSIAVIIVVGTLLVFFNTKDRKSSLNISRDENTIYLLLGDDEYCDFDISDIKDDKKKIEEELIKVIQNRAKELVKFVDRVTFLKDGDKPFEGKLYKIILNAK